jgi:hypothetical protein
VCLCFLRFLWCLGLAPAVCERSSVASPSPTPASRSPISRRPVASPRSRMKASKRWRSMEHYLSSQHGPHAQELTKVMKVKSNPAPPGGTANVAV